jgi:hypothetical protein
MSERADSENNDAVVSVARFPAGPRQLFVPARAFGGVAGPVFIHPGEVGVGARGVGGSEGVVPQSFRHEESRGEGHDEEEQRRGESTVAPDPLGGFRPSAGGVRLHDALFQVRAEVVREGVHVGVARFGRTGHRAFRDRDEFVRDAGNDVGQSSRRALHPGRSAFVTRRIGAVVRGFPGEEVVKDRAEGVDVGAGREASDVAFGLVSGDM